MQRAKRLLGCLIYVPYYKACFPGVGYWGWGILVPMYPTVGSFWSDFLKPKQQRYTNHMSNMFQFAGTPKRKRHKCHCHALIQESRKAWLISMAFCVGLGDQTWQKKHGLPGPTDVAKTCFFYLAHFPKDNGTLEQNKTQICSGTTGIDGSEILHHLLHIRLYKRWEIPRINSFSRIFEASMLVPYHRTSV